MEEQKTNQSSAGKGMGIAGLVLGILAAIISFVPCLGVYALVPGIVGIVLSVVSIVQANKANAAKGMAIAGLVCSIVGCCLAGYQGYVLSTAGDRIKEGMEELEKSGALDSLNKAMEELKDITDSLKHE